MTEPLLRIDQLRVRFDTPEGVVHAVNDVSFQVGAGETLAIVGESGCGKSVTALSILRLLPSPPARLAGGSIRFQGQELTSLGEAALRRLRGDRIGMVFQEPMTSLNPVLTIGRQLTEGLRRHHGLSRRAARERVLALLERVQIPDPSRRLDQYPHELSGGMRQRVMIAIAVACAPSLLIADEPTTALDVTIQAQVLDLIGELCEAMGTAVILVTHDLGVVGDVADRVVVMYAGRVVEDAAVDDLFSRPLHPYTQGLFAARPNLTPTVAGQRARLTEIPGMVPSLRAGITGCAFAPRCQAATAQCRAQAPLLRPFDSSGHAVACHHAGGGT
ncbi:ABC transporter ATP-binding protein [Vineibacter terrae]|uniref:ABC transporter ATP-binding protein n=1 Tax=Vineibacter terrae TaxID=2586908 RepID=UPI002E302D92|nr:ABC transporter ATP-binding protein [Vineibacter terrae]HEX2886269.1 ABC transporter ATP-binding protein [Vineibacter terrae]